ncbi:MAG: hypothetical protein ABI847_10200 [Anaerolineales bacterium]
MPFRWTRRSLLLAAPALVGAAYALPIVVHVYVSTYTRYMADDFCFAGEAINRGLADAEAYWFATSNARYSFLFLDGLTALIGAWTTAILPALVLGLWFGSLVWLLAQLRLAEGTVANVGLAGLMAAVILGAVAVAIPNPAQSVYWKGGLLTYTAPLAAGTFLAGLLAWQFRRPVGWAGVLAIAATAFFAGGFSELYSVVQAALLALAGAVTATRLGAQKEHARRGMRGLAVALAATVLALATLSLAPGTLARRATFPAAPGLGALIWNSWQYSLWFLRDAAGQQGALLLAVAGAGAALALGLPGRSTATTPRLLLALALLPVATLGFLMAAYAPAFYAVLYLPPDRVLIVHWFFFVMAVGAWGYLAGLAARPRLANTARRWPIPEVGWAALALALTLPLAAPPVLGAMSAARRLTEARNYAATWDAIDRQLRAARTAGAGNLALPLLVNPGGIDNYSADPQFWVNQCAQLYYGVAVSAFDPPPLVSDIALAHRVPLEAEIGGAARVLGYRLDTPEVHAGGTLTVTVYWQPVGSTEQPQTVFIHLYDPAAGRSLAQVDRAPGDGQYPTSLWIHGRVFADTYALAVPAGTAAANAVLILGLYDPATNQRLAVTGTNAGPAGSDWVQFGQVAVKP